MLVSVLDRIHLTGPIGVMLHQCSSCRYVRTNKFVVERHVATRCLGARVLSREVSVTETEPTESAPAEPEPVQASPAEPVQASAEPEPVQAPPTEWTDADAEEAEWMEAEEIEAEQTETPGFVYMVQHDDLPWSKIGRTTGTLVMLKARYNTYYVEPSILAVACDRPRAVERAIKNAMRYNDMMIDMDRARELVKGGEAARSVFLQVVSAWCKL